MSSLTAWSEVFVSLLAFLLGHLLPLRPALRAKLTSALGNGGFTALYSLLSLGLLAWLVVSVTRAPVLVLWYYQPWQHWVTLVGMALSCTLFCLAIGAPNPLSFGGSGNERFDPDKPGIVGLCRHPLLVALGLWATAHLFPNGELATVLLFASMAGFCALGMLNVDRKRRRQLGTGPWQSLAVNTRLFPGLRTLLNFCWRSLSPWRVLSGLALFLTLLYIHPRIIGVNALPPMP